MYVVTIYREPTAHSSIKAPTFLPNQTIVNATNNGIHSISSNLHHYLVHCKYRYLVKMLN